MHTPLYGSTFLQLPQYRVNEKDDANFTRFSYIISIEKHTIRPKSRLPCYEASEQIY